MRFCPADYHAVVSSLHDAQIQVRVRLCVGCQTPVTLRVRHGTVHRKVCLLNVMQIFFEILMIMCSILLIDVICGRILSVKCIHTYTSLETCSRLLSTKSLHLYLVSQIIRTHVNVIKPVDFPSVRQRHRHQCFMLRNLCKIIRHFYRIQRRPQDRVIDRIFDFLTKHIHLEIQFPHAFYILFACHKCHNYYRLSFFIFSSISGPNH